MPSEREAPSPLPADLAGWRQVWEGDRPFPIASSRRFAGGFVVGLKKLLRPFWKAPLGDLFERQRAYNIELIARLEALSGRLAAIDGARQELHRDLLEVRDDLLADVQQHHRRLEHLEGFKTEGLEDLMRHVDALFSRLDQKVERLGRPPRSEAGGTG